MALSRANQFRLTYDSSVRCKTAWCSTCIAPNNDFCVLVFNLKRFFMLFELMNKLLHSSDGEYVFLLVHTESRTVYAALGVQCVCETLMMTPSDLVWFH